ncbi:MULTISPECIES: ribonuclease R [Terrabacteria group]|uniref:ribonuclease R n=1 Tax=Bacillati TaxID=1783272 RepID=UPI001C6F333B|nr:MULTISPECIES: ribonuclease R [Terrabacteria group]MBW9212604.1 ribonuclease R [Trueperella sp. zg.1013]
MEELEKRILRYLQTEPRHKHTVSHLLEAFQMVSSSDFIRLNRILEKMEREYLVFRNTHNEFLTQSQAKVMEGRLSVNRMGVGFVDMEDEKSYRIETADLASAMHGDLVLIQALKIPPFAKVIAIKERAKDTIVGTLLVRGKKIYFEADDERLKERKVRLSYSKDFLVIDGLKVVGHITGYGNPLDVIILKAIGHKDDPGTDIASILVDHEIPLEFPDEVVEELKFIPREVQSEQLLGRKDLRNQTFVTIDGDSSKDFDDAVSVERNEDGYRLWVSIADVSSYVKEDTALDREAQQRSFSTYVVDRVVPMLPHELSNGICSLNPHVNRLTLTCEMQISKKGQIVFYDVYPSVINSKERMTYNKVNQILIGDESVMKEYASMGDFFMALLECADAIRHERVNKGAINFEHPETSMDLDEKGKPIRIYAKRRGVSEEVIEDCMIAANVAVAKYLQEHKIPGIYRIHEEPGAKRIKEYRHLAEILGKPFTLKASNIRPKNVQQFLTSIQDEHSAPVLNMMMLRTMQKARYDIQNRGHFGLAEQDYLHFTSPIRRYPDLIVHRMLWKYVFDGNKKWNKDKDNSRNQEFAEHASRQERNCADAEYACLDMKKAEYMQDHLGERFDGIIIGVTRFGVFVQLENTVEGLVQTRSIPGDYYMFHEDRNELIGQRNGVTYRIGQAVKVKVVEADKQKGNVTFEFVLPRQKFQDDRGKKSLDSRRREEDSISYWDNPKDRKQKFEKDKKKPKIYKDHAKRKKESHKLFDKKGHKKKIRYR